MDLTPDNIESVKSSWNLVISHHLEEQFMSNFYGHLFSTYPEVKSYFPDNKISLNSKLLETLNLAINGLDYIDALENDLKELGKFHENMNITADQYFPVIESSLHALNEVINKELTQFDKQSWINAFQLISNIMISGYTGALPENSLSFDEPSLANTETGKNPAQ
ncbi:MAG: globin domain-containing protein [Gammaproteobacteria bacterium]|nr:globin domain-containing protein [Gammaproteobacteria bacterium]